MISRRTRIFLGLLAIYIAGIAFLLYRVVLDIDPRYRESAEESLVETAQFMASLVEQDVIAGAINPARLAPLFRSVYARPFSAQIYNLHKDRVELRMIVTDRNGRVLFDSLGRATGADYSRWADVALTLTGQYGARTSRDVPGDPLSSVMYVGAPVRWEGEIVGVVSVGKPVRSFGQFVDDARERTLWVGAGSAAALLLLLALLLAVWLVRPFGLTADYIAWLRTQRGLHPLRMARHALDMVRGAFGEMRDAVTGRNYVADYVQTFTHEIKSPLSAIRGAAELLQEADMPPGERARFAANIAGETQRIQQIVDRMMELTALEARRVLGRTEPVALGTLLQDVAASARPAAAARAMRLRVDRPREDIGELHAEGDPFLLRQAVSNLLDNAIDFSPDGAEVVLALRAAGRRQAVITVRDHGPGIPDYAQGKLFQKFYSLERPHSRRKSTGLGLAFVQEIAALHHGRIELGNAKDGGAVATLTLTVVARP